jgi:hypothetical protein
MPRLFMSNNDVINAGHNNWLFAPGTDMDRALDHLSHMQKCTKYVINFTATESIWQFPK